MPRTKKTTRKTRKPLPTVEVPIHSRPNLTIGLLFVGMVFGISLLSASQNYPLLTLNAADPSFWMPAGLTALTFVGLVTFLSMFRSKHVIGATSYTEVGVLRSRRLSYASLKPDQVGFVMKTDEAWLPMLEIEPRPPAQEWKAPIEVTLFEPEVFLPFVLHLRRAERLDDEHLLQLLTLIVPAIPAERRQELKGQRVASRSGLSKLARRVGKAALVVGATSVGLTGVLADAQATRAMLASLEEAIEFLTDELGPLGPLIAALEKELGLEG